MATELNLNRRAHDLAQTGVRQADALRVGISTCAGAQLVDCGNDTRGGYRAGLWMARICLEIGRAHV